MSEAKESKWCPAATYMEADDAILYCDREAAHPGSHHAEVGDGSEVAWSDAAALMELLLAVREAIDIPHGATNGDEEVRAKIMEQRVMHAVIALRRIDQPHLNASWDAASLRDNLTTCPAEGYKTFAELAVELKTASVA